MADKARNYTDEELQAMEKYLADIYSQAEKDLVKKFKDFMKDFERLEKKNQKKVDNGKWTQEEFEVWRKNKLLYSQHWTRLIKQVQNEMVECNSTALDYVNDVIPQIFAVNYNEIGTVIGDSPVSGYTFELVNADTVKNLATGNEIILPPKKNMDIPKDQLWNAKLVNAQLLQGILQGESIPKMAQRMANVCNSNLKAATRTARTMTTAAENAGRQSGINRATADGIILIKEWLATNDERTRDSHVAVNHERIRCDASTEKEKKFSNGLAFPGDWHGKPSEVYNCRCTIITKYAGVDRKLLKKAIKRQEKIDYSPDELNNKSESIASKVSKDLKDLMTNEEYSEFEKFLTKNPLVKKAYEYVSKYITWNRTGNPSRYSQINKQLAWNFNVFPEFNVFTAIFHEIGHALDYLINCDCDMSETNKLYESGLLKKPFTSKISASKEFIEAMRKDKKHISTLFLKADQKEKDEALSGGSYTIQEFAEGIFCNRNWIRREIEIGHGFSYYDQAYESALKSGMSKKQIVDLIRESGYNIKEDYEAQEILRDYYISSELWANITAACSIGGKDVEKIMKYCPNTYEAYLKFMKEV